MAERSGEQFLNKTCAKLSVKTSFSFIQLFISPYSKRVRITSVCYIFAHRKIKNIQNIRVTSQGRTQALKDCEFFRHLSALHHTLLDITLNITFYLIFHSHYTSTFSLFLIALCRPTLLLKSFSTLHHFISKSYLLYQHSFIYSNFIYTQTYAFFIRDILSFWAFVTFYVIFCLFFEEN